MFKNIQKQLLLKYPLLWNTKFIPMLILGCLYYLVFFLLGYEEGRLDFSGTYDDPNNGSGIIIFGVFISIIIFILWLVFYFRNNAFKAFYQKSKNALFYEWFQIFVIAFLFISFYIPFSIGKQLKQRSYFSYEETKKRCEIIDAAYIFIDGTFRTTETDSILMTEYIAKNPDVIVDDYAYNYNEFEDNYSADGEYLGKTERSKLYHYFKKDHIIYKGKKYDEYSLMNRNGNSFSILNIEEKPLLSNRIRDLLHTNNSGEIKKLMSNFLAISKEHKLNTNLDVEKWFSITYNNPSFEKFLYIRPYYYKDNGTNDYGYNRNYNYKFYNVDDDNKKYSKYYLQFDVLDDKYASVSNAHTNPLVDFNGLLGFVYGAFVISLLLFSFRVSSGKAWLISIVVFGVINIFIGILSNFLGFNREENVYFVLAFLLIVIFISYYLYSTYVSKTKQYSQIALVISLWTFGAIIPLIYNFVLAFYRNEMYLNANGVNVRTEMYQKVQDFLVPMILINFIVAIIVMFLFSRSIRTWKGISEE